MKNTIALVLLTLGVTAAGPAAASCLSDRLTGVNLAGAEFGRTFPGVKGRDYIYPDTSELKYFADQGANVIRLPFRWERLQPSLGGGFNTAELAEIQTIVKAAKELKMCVVLDVHNYGAYYGNPIGSSAVPRSAFIEFWKNLARQFPDEQYVAFGLMNEPAELTLPQWAAIAKETHTALRNAGAKNMIYMSGGRWSGVHEWHKQFSGSSNAEEFASFRDPLKRTVFEVHQYADSDYSGTHYTCLDPSRFDAMFKNISEWARTNGQKLFLGEIGVPPSSQCMAALDKILGLSADPKVWQGWTYWAAGPWWGDYPFSVAQRSDGSDAEQMKLLRKHFYTPVARPRPPVLRVVE